jgi:hypothetical protein
VGAVSDMTYSLPLDELDGESATFRSDAGDIALKIPRAHWEGQGRPGWLIFTPREQQ